MARSFNPLAFLRHAPHDLLQHYFRQREVLGDFIWNDETTAEEIFKAVSALPDDRQAPILGDFLELHLRTRDGGFVRAILDEAKYHDDHAEIDGIFSTMRNALQKALWIFLNRKDVYWDGANVIWRVDKITSRNRWQSRRDLPARPGRVDEAMVHELQRALIEHFRKEGRGHRCKVEAYRRGGEELFYAYPEDYATTVVEYDGDDLAPRSVKPAFEIIFRHVDRDRQLDIHSEGQIVDIGELQVLFARAILDEDIDPEYELSPPVYDLDKLLASGFEFDWPEATSIHKVHVKAIRAVLATDTFQRITVEADPDDDERAAYNLLRSAALGAECDVETIDQIVLRVTFKKEPHERRARSRTVRITSPHTCHMDHDEWGERIHQMLQRSGIENSDPNGVIPPDGSR